jgi:hypothetical protein
MFVWMEMQKKNKKKIKFLCTFVECQGHCARQSWETALRKLGNCVKLENWLRSFLALPRAVALALGKDFFKKIK